MNQTNRIIAKEILLIAKELLSSEGYEYIYDPTHKKHPGGGFKRTPKGWSRKRPTHVRKRLTRNYGDLGTPSGEVNKVPLQPTELSRKINSYQPEVAKCFLNIKRASDEINSRLFRNMMESQKLSAQVAELARHQYSTGELTCGQREELLNEFEALESETKILERKREYIAFEGLKLPEDQRGKIQVGKVESEVPEFKDIYKTPFKYLEKATHKDVMPKTSLNVSVTKPSTANENRGGYGDGTIFLKTNSASSLWLHETAHWIENNNSKVKKRCIEFLEYRTQGENAEKLYDIDHKYEQSEYTKKDAFFNPYCGKLYIENGKIISTEILSMGLQELMEHPFQFFRNDPEYFGFVIGILRGDLL